MTDTPTTLHEQVRAIGNLLAFATKSGIPYRTLNRIKGAEHYPMSKTTELALSAALKRIKPKAKP